MSAKKWVMAGVATFLIAVPLQHAQASQACNFPGGGGGGGNGWHLGWSLHNTHLGEFLSRLRDIINSHRR
jgi:hypothetical protein